MSYKRAPTVFALANQKSGLHFQFLNPVEMNGIDERIKTCY